MTIRRLARALGLCGVAALGIFSIVASNPDPPQGGGPPAAPSMLSLEIPSNTVGTFVSVTPAMFPTATVPANYFVLPLLTTTAPIVRVRLSSPYPSDLTVTATDATRGQTVTLAKIPSGSQGPTTGYFQVISVTPNNPATWYVVIRYPNSFQGSQSISTMISDTVGGVASAPLTFAMSVLGSTVSMLSLQIPNDAFGNAFSGVMPAVLPTATVVANYFVLPLLPTTAPIVRVLLRSPFPGDLTVTATDATRGETVTLAKIPSGNPGPATGFFQVISVTPNNPATWHLVIRYPNSFQGSKSIGTLISHTVGGVASPPLVFVMSFRGATLTVSIATENNDGKVTSNPPGIDCPGVCSFDFLSANSVSLTQSVLHNQTQFMGWTGSCVGNGNSCTVPLSVPGTAIVPLNAAVTANFRIHTNSAIPPAFSCPAPPLLPKKQWVTQPNCGAVLFATLQCDTNGYFCCGAQGGTPSPRCNGQNLTAVTCSTSGLIGGPVTHELIQPGGCYVTVP